MIVKTNANIAEVFYNVNYVNVNYSVKNSTVDCKYLLFLQDFFFRLKPKQYKKCQYSWLFKKTIWKLIKNKVNIYNQQLNFWLNNWRLHNWRSRKPQLLIRLLGIAKYLCTYLLTFLLLILPKYKKYVGNSFKLLEN